MKYIHTLEIKEYNKWLVITVRNFGPKIKRIGTGLLFSGFNMLDLKISPAAIAIITDNLNVNTDKKDPVMEIINHDRIWWASNNGIIIPPGEHFHIYTIPVHTTGDNYVDQKIMDVIDGKK